MRRVDIHVQGSVEGHTWALLILLRRGNIVHDVEDPDTTLVTRARRHSDKDVVLPAVCLADMEAVLGFAVYASVQT